ncbi:hypothetical protein BO71DRAFT_442191 [Aspergillus ellipticus CBS 707.79]|uniref:Hydrophobin n=1 Tax=Aspergillus ellipticus CBS 707.79 TaxID=1448320 RepID=A0A319DNI8_9EURO|nr:hypothetical protein BO71DRAFT_442191 [Aspergillus ellipticus CBS 707.79]
MQFTIATIVGFAMFATAAPSVMGSGQQKLSFDQAKGQCSIGDIYCCNPSNKEETSGFLNNLLQNGLILKTAIDGSGSSCATTSLIKDLNLLDFAEQGDDDKDSFCKNVIACCPNGDCASIGKA